jgi:putative transposase
MRDGREVILALGGLIDSKPSIGFWQCYLRLGEKGYRWNHKRVYRIYTQMYLNIRKRTKNRLQARVKQALLQPERINHLLSIDYLSDRIWNRKMFLILKIMHNFNREILAIV